MFAADAPWLIILGSLGGIAAIIGAINSWIQRKQGVRISSFEASQASMQAALIRCDTENTALRERVTEQDQTIFDLKSEVSSLSKHVGTITKRTGR